MRRFLAVILLSASCFGAAVTHGVSTASTSNTTAYTSGSFTPAASDLLIVFVMASGTNDAGGMTDSQGLGFTRIDPTNGPPVKNSSADTSYLFVANALAANSAMTVTFNCAGDAATGSIIEVARVSGMTEVGSAAIRQSHAHSNLGTGGTPGSAFDSNALTGNATLAFAANGTNPATLIEPTGWTERDDTGYTTPNNGAEYASRDSGFTGTSIIWGATSSSSSSQIVVELDASSPTTTIRHHANSD